MGRSTAGLSKRRALSRQRKGRLKNKYSGQDDDATRCDTTMLVAAFRVVSTSCLPWPKHGVTVAWNSSDAAGLNTNSNYSSTSYHSQFVGRHLINKNVGKSRGGHQSESSRTNTTTIAKRPQSRCCIGCSSDWIPSLCQPGSLHHASCYHK